MSIDPRVLSEQFDRLRVLNYFPPDEVPQREIRNALTSAPSEIVLMAVVNEWIRTQTERPTPADLYRLIDKLSPADKEDEWRPDPDCKHCLGEGFPHFEREGISYVGSRCSCWARRPAPHFEAAPIQIEPPSRIVRTALARGGEAVTQQILARLDGEVKSS